MKAVDVLDHDILTAKMEVVDRNTLMATRVHRLFSVSPKWLQRNWTTSTVAGRAMDKAATAPTLIIGTIALV